MIGRRWDESEVRLQECTIVTDHGLLRPPDLPWQISTSRASPRAFGTEPLLDQGGTKYDYLLLLRSDERNRPAPKGPSAVVGE